MEGNQDEGEVDGVILGDDIVGDEKAEDHNE
jgi:hypothetical protein